MDFIPPIFISHGSPRLQPLARRGVLVLASGGLTHNLRDIVGEATDGEDATARNTYRDYQLAALALDAFVFAADDARS